MIRKPLATGQQREHHWTALAVPSPYTGAACARPRHDARWAGTSRHTPISANQPTTNRLTNLQASEARLQRRANWGFGPRGTSDAGSLDVRTSPLCTIGRQCVPPGHLAVNHKAERLVVGIYPELAGAALGGRGDRALDEEVAPPAYPRNRRIASVAPAGNQRFGPFSRRLGTV